MRALLVGVMVVVSGLASAPAAPPLPTSVAGEPVDVLRVKAEQVDALLDRARTALDAGRMTREAYVAMLQVLRDEELALHAAAAARVYDSEAASNYWHRGRLKFPTRTQQELDRMARRP